MVEEYSEYAENRAMVGEVFGWRREEDAFPKTRI